MYRVYKKLSYTEIFIAVSDEGTLMIIPILRAQSMEVDGEDFDFIYCTSLIFLLVLRYFTNIYLFFCQFLQHGSILWPKGPHKSFSAQFQEVNLHEFIKRYLCNFGVSNETFLKR